MILAAFFFLIADQEGHVFEQGPFKTLRQCYEQIVTIQDDHTALMRGFGIPLEPLVMSLCYEKQEATSR